MSQEERVKRLQKKTARNLNESLQEWHEELRDFTQRMNAITLKQYNSIEQVDQAVGELVVIYQEVVSNDEELVEYDHDTKTLLDTLTNNKQVTELTEKLQKFFESWEDLKREVQLQQLTIKDNTIAQLKLANEERLMIEWEDKSMVTEELLNVVHDVAKFCDEPASHTNHDDYLTAFEDLAAKVITHVGIIDSNLIDFKDLHENQLRMRENRDKVKNQWELVIRKKNDLMERLEEARRTVVAVAVRMKMEHDEDGVRMELDSWQKLLDDNSKILKGCDIEVLSTFLDTVKTIDVLEALLAQIGTRDAILSVFETSSAEVVKTLNSTTSSELAQLLQNFFKNWEICQNQAEERLDAFRKQLVRLEKNETKNMIEWQEMVIKTMTWLDEKIAESRTYGTFDLQNHLYQFLEMLKEINNRVGLIKNQKEYGRRLVNEFKKKNNKDAILANIRAISHKEDLLQVTLNSADVMYGILSDRLTIRSDTARNIEESVAEWQALLDFYTDTFNSIDSYYKKGENDAPKTLDLITVMFTDVKSHEKRLDKFKEDTDVLIESLNVEQAEKATTTCQLFFKNWDFNWDNFREMVDILKIQVRKDIPDNGKMAAEWKISSNFINNWLTRAESDIVPYIKTGQLTAKEIAEDKYHLRADQFHISQVIPRELVVRLEDEGKGISEKIDHYLQVAAEGTLENMRTIGFEDVIDYQGRKILLDNKLLNASTLLDEIETAAADLEAVRLSLKSWWEVLRAKIQSFEEIDLKAYSEEAVARLTELIAETDMTTTEVQEFIVSSSQTLESSPFCKHWTSALKDDVSHFHEEWIKSLNTFIDAKAPLEMRSKTEDEIMTEWHRQKTVTEDILTMEEEISVYAEAPVDLDNYEDYFSKFEELESKFLRGVSVVDESIGKGSEICDAVSSDKKEEIMSSIETFAEKKTIIEENLFTARKVVVEIVEKKWKLKECEDELNPSFEEWRRVLDEWTATLNECATERTSTVTETRIVIPILEKLLTDIDSCDNEFDAFQQRGNELLAFLDEEKSSSWNAELTLLVSNYEKLKDEVHVRLALFQNSLKMQLSKYDIAERWLMDDWTPSVVSTLEWLKVTEKKCATFSVLPEDLFDMQNFLVEFGDLEQQIPAKLEYIKELKEHAHGSLSVFHEQENEDKVSNDITMIEEGEERLRLTLDVIKNLIDDEIPSLVLKRVDALQEWLPTVQKRMGENDGVGPDPEIVDEQIKEMKTMQAQTTRMSISGLFDPYKSNPVLKFLSEEDRTNLLSANDEWNEVKNWVDKRLNILGRAEVNWDDFKARKLDLAEYLSDTEQELKSVVGIHLNDTETVQLRSSGLLNVTKGMEARKDHVEGMTESSERLIDLLITVNYPVDQENPVYQTIPSQVAEILDSWNNLVKRSFELKLKLDECMEKFKSCCVLYEEVNDWIDDCNQLLDLFQADSSGEHIEILTVKLDAKRNEEVIYREKLHNVHLLDEHLSREGEVCPHYILPKKGEVKILNKDYRDTVGKLNQLEEFSGKMKIFSRKARGSISQFTRRVSTSLTTAATAS